MDSVWCTLPQCLPGVMRFIDNRRKSRGLRFTPYGVVLDQELGIARFLFMLNCSIE